MPGLLDILGGLLGGGVLGGQAPPQQAQRAPPATLPGYGGAENNPLMAGLANLGTGGSPIGAIGNAIIGLTTGQRTDPVGAYQQMANMTYRLLRQAGVPDAQAQLGAVNPDVQKHIISRMFPTYTAHNIGNVAGSFDPEHGIFNPQYVAPEWRTVQPGETGGTFQPPVMPQGGGVPPPTAVTRSPLAPIPVPGPEVPGASSGGGRPPSATGPGTPTMPTTTVPASSGRGVPPIAASGFTPLVTGGSVAEKAAAETGGAEAGRARQTLKGTVDDLQSTIDMIDALVGNPAKNIPPHPGKHAAVGPIVGGAPATALAPGGYGQQQDFIKRLGTLQTNAAKQLAGEGAGVEKDKVAITGLDRQVTEAQFDQQMAALRKSLVDKQEAAKAAATIPGTATAPTAPQVEPPPTGTGAAGASGAGQGAPLPPGVKVPEGFRRTPDGRYISIQPGPGGKYVEWRP